VIIIKVRTCRPSGRRRIGLDDEDDDPSLEKENEVQRETDVAADKPSMTPKR
jgi:hypothetical protein